MLKVQIKSNSDDLDSYEAVVDLVEWTDTEFKFNLNFDHPSLISRGVTRDQLAITVLKPEYFVSAESGLGFEPKDQGKVDYIMVKPIPR